MNVFILQNVQNQKAKFIIKMDFPDHDTLHDKDGHWSCK